jgi:hypothetical protein
MSYQTFSAAYPKDSVKTPLPPGDLLTPEKTVENNNNEIEEMTVELYNLLYPIIYLKKFLVNYLGNPCQIIFRLLMLIILVYFIKYY